MLLGPQNLPERIAAVRLAMAEAAARAGQSGRSVTLLAVTKAQPPEMVRAAADCGLTDFGESYLQEALPKLDALRDRTLTWHYVGRVQANKTRSIAERFAWVHALDRAKIAARLSEARSPHLPPLNVCLQVNIAAEHTKGGVTVAELGPLARAVAVLPRLKLRGLMCIPPEESDAARQRSWFRELHRLYAALNAEGAGLDTLSMGMSGDFEAAIEEGATIVRIGTALFGARAGAAA